MISKEFNFITEIEFDKGMDEEGGEEINWLIFSWWWMTRVNETLSVTFYHKYWRIISLIISYEYSNNLHIYEQRIIIKMNIFLEQE